MPRVLYNPLMKKLYEKTLQAGIGFAFSWSADSPEGTTARNDVGGAAQGKLGAMFLDINSSMLHAIAGGRPYRDAEGRCPRTI